MTETATDRWMRNVFGGIPYLGLLLIWSCIQLIRYPFMGFPMKLDTAIPIFCALIAIVMLFIRVTEVDLK